MRIGSSELQKSVKSAIKAIKGSGGDGDLSAVRRKIRALSALCALRGAGYRKAIGDAPEKVRDMRGKRGKGPAGGEVCAISALIIDQELLQILTFLLRHLEVGTSKRKPALLSGRISVLGGLFEGSLSHR